MLSHSLEKYPSWDEIAEAQTRHNDPYIYSDEFAGIDGHEVELPEDDQQAFVDAMLIQGRALIAAIGIVILSLAILGAVVRLHPVEQQLAADARV